MRIERVFELINNLDEPEPRRRFMAQWSTVVVDRNGVVADVIRHREAPSETLHRMHMDLYPESVQFTAAPGLYSSIEELAAKLKECAWAHKYY